MKKETINHAAARLGQLGGQATAAKYTAEELTERMRQIAIARWKKRKASQLPAKTA